MHQTQHLARACRLPSYEDLLMPDSCFVGPERVVMKFSEALHYRGFSHLNRTSLSIEMHCDVCIHTYSQTILLWINPTGFQLPSKKVPFHEINKTCCSNFLFRVSFSHCSSYKTCCLVLHSASAIGSCLFPYSWLKSWHCLYLWSPRQLEPVDEWINRKLPL